MKNPFKVPFARILIKPKELVKGRTYYKYEDVIEWAKKELKTKSPKNIWNKNLFKLKSNQKVKHGKGKNK